MMKEVIPVVGGLVAVVALVITSMVLVPERDGGDSTSGKSPLPASVSAATGGSAGSGSAGKSEPHETTAAAASKALFVVVRPDGNEVWFSWTELKKMPLTRMTAEGRLEEGVRLMDVLNSAGITLFASVHLTGSSNPAALSFEEVEDKATILDFTMRGTVKLATLRVPKAQWTKDVARIQVIDAPRPRAGNQSR
jgi:hypothetical protein